MKARLIAVLLVSSAIAVFMLYPRTMDASLNLTPGMGWAAIQACPKLDPTGKADSAAAWQCIIDFTADNQPGAFKP